MKKTLLAAVAALAAVGAQAATISFNYGLPIIQSTTEITQTGQLGLFDSTLGNLTGARLEIFGAATTSITLTNNAAQSQNARATSFVNLGWSSSSNAAIDAILTDDIAINFTTGAAQSYAVGQTRTFGPLTDSGTFAYDLSGAVLSAITGAGTFGITCASESGVTTIGGGGNVASSQSTEAGCGARIEYTYTVVPPPIVPEPASLALVGLALAGVAAASRRRKA